MPTKQTLMTVLLAVTCATSASAECLSDAEVSDLVANYLAKKPAAEARRDICTLKDDIFGFGSCFA